MACEHGGQRVAGHEQAAQEDLREDERGHELHGLELGLRERAHEEPERRSEHGVGDRDQAEHHDRALDVQAEEADRAP